MNRWTGAKRLFVTIAQVEPCEKPERHFMKAEPTTAMRMAQALARLLVTGLGAGYSRVMPGTCGTFSAFFLSLALASAFPFWDYTKTMIMLAFSSSVAGIILIRYLQRTTTEFSHSEDPQQIVIDEWAGFFITAALLPSGNGAILAFILFRVFDMLKPPPIRQFERLPGALGIMADDLIAGFLAGFAGLLLLSLGLRVN